MTREKEIRQRIERLLLCFPDYEGDTNFKELVELLTHNEELQREKEKMQAVVDAAKEWEKCNKRGSKSIDIFAVVKAADNLRDALASLDAKEQDDD